MAKPNFKKLLSLSICCVIVHFSASFLFAEDLKRSSYGCDSDRVHSDSAARSGTSASRRSVHLSGIETEIEEADSRRGVDIEEISLRKREARSSETEYVSFDQSDEATVVPEEYDEYTPVRNVRSRPAKLERLTGRTRVTDRRVRRTNQQEADLPELGEIVPEPEPGTGPVPGYESEDLVNPGIAPERGWFNDCFTPCCDPLSDPCLDRCFNQRLFIPHVGGVFLHRSKPRSDVLIFNPFNPTENLNANQFDLGWGFGLDAGFTGLNAFSPGNDLEVRFWGINDWSDQRLFQSSDPATQINTTPPTIVAGAQDVTARLSTELYSFEANWRHRWEGFPVAASIGFRSLELYDRFDATFADPNGILSNAVMHVKTRNHLYGLQAGLEAPIISNCGISVRGFTKAGIFGNATSNDDLFRCNCAIPITYRTSDSSDRVAMLAEAGLNARVALGRNWWLTGQYQAMWLGGVTTATDQINHANFTTGNGINSRSGILYHGGMVGIERAF